jgi:hypothetical protein
MPLVKCSDCGAQVAEAALICPHCGAPRPLENGYLIVKYSSRVNGRALRTEVYVDDVHFGGIRFGRQLKIELAPGRHVLLFRATRGKIASGAVIIQPGFETFCGIGFRFWTGRMKAEID